MICWELHMWKRQETNQNLTIASYKLDSTEGLWTKREDLPYSSKFNEGQGAVSSFVPCRRRSFVLLMALNTKKSRTHFLTIGNRGMTFSTEGVNILEEDYLLPSVILSVSMKLSWIKTGMSFEIEICPTLNDSYIHII